MHFQGTLDCCSGHVEIEGVVEWVESFYCTCCIMMKNGVFAKGKQVYNISMKEIYPHHIIKSKFPFRQGRPSTTCD